MRLHMCICDGMYAWMNACVIYMFVYRILCMREYGNFSTYACKYACMHIYICVCACAYVCAVA